MDIVDKEKKSCVIMGDINIDLLKDNLHNKTNEYVDNVISRGFNYRPVSLLPAFSKILEKVMFNKIMSFIDYQQILYKHQYGFRPKHSTIHQLIHLLN